MSLGAAVSLAVPGWGQRSCWALIPVRARSCSLLCAPVGSGFGDSSVSPACPAELAQPVGRSLGCGQDRGVPAPAPHWPWWTVLSPCCPQRQGGDFSARLSRSSGALQTPGAAEPILVPSGSQFLTPGLGMQLPRCSTPSSAPSLPWGFPPSSLGSPWAVPVSHCLQGQCCSCPGRGTDSSVQFPAGQGRFVPVSASLPRLCPVYLHPWLQGWNVPGADLALPSRLFLTGSSCSPGSHSSSFPGTAMGTVCCVLLCSFGSLPAPGAGAGREFLQAGILPAHAPPSSPLPFPMVSLN